MSKKMLYLIIIVTLAACSPEATPAPTPEPGTTTVNFDINRVPSELLSDPLPEMGFSITDSGTTVRVFDSFTIGPEIFRVNSIVDFNVDCYITNSVIEGVEVYSFTPSSICGENYIKVDVRSAYCHEDEDGDYLECQIGDLNLMVGNNDISFTIVDTVYPQHRTWIEEVFTFYDITEQLPSILYPNVNYVYSK